MAGAAGNGADGFCGVVFGFGLAFRPIQYLFSGENEFVVIHSRNSSFDVSLYIFPLEVGKAVFGQTCKAVSRLTESDSDFVSSC